MQGHWQRDSVCVMFEKGLKRAETRSGMRWCGRTCSTASNKAKYEMSSHNDKSTNLPAVCEILASITTPLLPSKPQTLLVFLAAVSPTAQIAVIMTHFWYTTIFASVSWIWERDVGWCFFRLQLHHVLHPPHASRLKRSPHMGDKQRCRWALGKRYFHC